MSTSKPKKRSYHHGDLEAALLHSAGNILEKEGLEPLGRRAVARRAGVSHNAPYRHFTEREALLAALAAEGFERLGAATRTAGGAGGRGAAARAPAHGRGSGRPARHGRGLRPFRARASAALPADVRRPDFDRASRA